jgi:hypothetical protein
MIDINKLNELASSMQAMRKTPDARIFYDLMSDALLWTDEFPLLVDADAVSCFRYVLRYRTSIIIGQPEIKYERYWIEAYQLAPEWPGFLAERRAVLWASTYHILAEAGNARMQTFFNQHPD